MLLRFFSPNRDFSYSANASSSLDMIVFVIRCEVIMVLYWDLGYLSFEISNCSSIFLGTVQKFSFPRQGTGLIF